MRTSAGIVCIFWGMFDTIRGPTKIKCIFALLFVKPVRFSRFQKGRFPIGILKPQYSFTKTINGKSINWTPTGYATHLPSGDKTFSKFQKPEKPYRILKCSKDFITTINGKNINWTPTEYTTYLPSGDKTF